MQQRVDVSWSFVEIFSLEIYENLSFYHLAYLLQSSLEIAILTGKLLKWSFIIFKLCLK